MTVADSANVVLAFSQRQVDRLMSPHRRQKAWENTADFANARPLLFTFLLAQLTLSFVPLIIFASFMLATIAFAAGCAIVFTIFWLGIALLALVPTLFLTGGLALLLWAWAVGSFVVARWLWGLVPAGVKAGWEVEHPAANGNPNANSNSSYEGHSFLVGKRADGDGVEVVKKEGDLREQIL